MDKETQSRLVEFLLTYGWAVLVLFVAFGALVFFGLFPGAKGSSCSIEGFDCEAWQATSDGDITLVVKNSMGKDLNGVTIEVGDCKESFDVWGAGKILGGDNVTLSGCSVNEMLYTKPVVIKYQASECVVEGEISGIAG